MALLKKPSLRLRWPTVCGVRAMKKLWISRICGILLIAGLAPLAIQAQSAKDQAKDAGQESKQAAKDAGNATKNTAKKTGHKVKHTSKKAVNKGANKTEQGANKVEQKTR